MLETVAALAAIIGFVLTALAGGQYVFTVFRSKGRRERRKKIEGSTLCLTIGLALIALAIFLSR
ncbi:MAG TPA: hypothetical protein DEP87_02330 [Candidatus Pacebacteria bacterium]|nr:hypothetical protein [Candidatus Paceibacterota bacterium]